MAMAIIVLVLLLLLPVLVATIFNLFTRIFIGACHYENYSSSYDGHSVASLPGSKPDFWVLSFQTTQSLGYRAERV